MDELEYINNMINTDIQYEINGIKYVMIEELLSDNPTAKVKLEERIKKYKCLIQRSKVHQNFWFKSYVQLKVLVPETSVFDYIHANH